MGIGRRDHAPAVRSVAGPHVGVSACVANRDALGGWGLRRAVAGCRGDVDHPRCGSCQRRPAIGSGGRLGWPHPHRLGTCPRPLRSARRRAGCAKCGPGEPGCRRCDQGRRASFLGEGRAVATADPFAGHDGLSLGRGGRAGGLLAGPGLDAMEPLPAALRRRAAVLVEPVRDHAGQCRGALRRRIGNPRESARHAGRTIGVSARIGQRPGAAAADVPGSGRRVAGGASQNRRAHRLLRPRLSRPQFEVSHQRHHSAADRKRPAADHPARVCQPGAVRRCACPRRA